MALRLESETVVEIEIEDVLIDEKMGVVMATPFKHTVRLTGSRGEIEKQIDQKIAEVEFSIRKLTDAQAGGGRQKNQLMIDQLEKAKARYQQAKNDVQ